MVRQCHGLSGGSLSTLSLSLSFIDSEPQLCIVRETNKKFTNRDPFGGTERFGVGRETFYPDLMSQLTYFTLVLVPP